MSFKNQNQSFLVQFLNKVPIIKHLPFILRFPLIILTIFTITCSEFIIRAIFGTFLFQNWAFWSNWLIVIMTSLIISKIHKDYLRNIREWMHETDFCVDSETSIITSVEKAFSFGLGKIPLLVAILVYLVRFGVIIVWMPRMLPSLEWIITYPVTFVALIVNDVTTTLLVLLTIWYLILFGTVISYVGRHPIKIHIVSDYNATYGELNDLLLGLTFFFCIIVGYYTGACIQWSFESKLVYWTYLFISLSLFGATIFFFFALKGVHEGVKKSKENKVTELRNLSIQIDKNLGYDQVMTTIKEGENLKLKDYLTVLLHVKFAEDLDKHQSVDEWVVSRTRILQLILGLTSLIVASFFEHIMKALF